jgi:GLPGLI family protein
MRENLISRFIILLLLSLIFLPGYSVAQRPFKGRITYTISYPGSNIDLAELQELPVRVNVLTKNNQVRTEMSGQNASLFQVKVSNGESRQIATMLEILREKYVLKRNFQEIQNTLKSMPQVELVQTNESKVILNYNCRKVIARITDASGTEYESIIYYAPDIPGQAFNFDSPYFEIPGLMLEYEIRVGPLNIKYEVQSIKKRMFVSNRNFSIPKDFQETNYDELRARLQGNL